MLRTFTLSNGIHVATYQIPTVKSFHVGITVKGGSLVEKPEQSGLAHFMEHMLVQGIPSYSTAEALSSYVESLAGRYNAFTSLYTVHFSITVPFLHAQDGVKIAHEVFFQPLFPKEAFEKERQAVLNEMKQDMDARWYRFHEFFRHTKFTPTSILQQKTIGTPEAVQHVHSTDMIAYWKKYFVPRNTYIFIQGNFDQDTLQKWLEKYFSTVKNKGTFAGYPPLSSKKDLSERQVAIRQDDMLQVNYIDLAFPSLSRTDPLKDIVKQNMLLAILGGLRTSRLFALLRYQRGLVYGVAASNSQFPGLGFVNISSEVAPQHLDEVAKIIIDQTKKMMQEGPTKEELVLIKNYLSNSWLMAFDNPSSIGEWIENDFLWRDTIRMPEDYIELISDITIKDLLEMMEKYWDIKKLNLILQGPMENSEMNRERFEKMLRVLK